MYKNYDCGGRFIEYGLSDKLLKYFRALKSKADSENYQKPKNLSKIIDLDNFEVKKSIVSYDSGKSAAKLAIVVCLGVTSTVICRNKTPLLMPE